MYCAHWELFYYWMRPGLCVKYFLSFSSQQRNWHKKTEFFVNLVIQVASRNIDGRFPRSWTMTSHGFALLSLLNVHSQANLNNIYFDHINIIMYDISRIKIPWLRSFAVGTNSTLNFSRFFSQPGFSLWLK